MNASIQAEKIARRAHAGQFLKDGVTPRIIHTEAVVKRLQGEEDDVIAIAWLHDVIRDSKETPETLRRFRIPDRVVNIVSLLTNRNSGTYQDYIKAVNHDALSKKVKISDMIVNLYASKTDDEIRKYASGLLQLVNG